MIDKSTETSVKLCCLVEHPGGRDGGEFPQYEEYGVAGDGSLYYKTGSPECSNDSFNDEEIGQFVTVTNRKDALSVLKQELEESRRHTAALERLVAAFDLPVEFQVCFADRPYDEGQATTSVFDFENGEDAEDHDEEDEDWD